MHANPPNFERQPRFDRLPPLERRLPAPQHPPTRPSEQKAGHVEDVSVAVQNAPGADLTVRYAHDPVANVWVAALYNSTSGELVSTVPASRVMDQLAELRADLERSVDRRA